MNRTVFHLVFVILLSLSTIPKTLGQLQCENDTSYLRSLIDLKTATYLDFQGGLYPNGANIMPYAHNAAGMNIARQVLPLDSLGNLDLIDGKAGFICLGASTAGNAFNHFKSVADADPTVNPCLKLVNCAVGAKGLEIMIDTVVNGWYWDTDVMSDLIDANLSRQQVQVIWLMVTSRIDTILTWPYQPFSVTAKYEALMPVLLAKFPNLKQVYLSGFNYGGYADPTKEFYEMIIEPSSYWNNWSVKFLIENQIEGDTDLIYSGPARKSAWLAWGPHLWADGMRANVTDGLKWNCAIDYKPDGGGYHMSNEGKEKEGKIIFEYFKHAPFAADWFLYKPRWIGCDPELKEEFADALVQEKVSVFPNPANGGFAIYSTTLDFEQAHIQLFNALGQLMDLPEPTMENNNQTIRINCSTMSAGNYIVVITTKNQCISQPLIISR